MYKSIYNRFKRFVLVTASVMALACMPMTGAHAATQTAQCQVNGQPGVYISIKVNGQNCVPIGNGIHNNAIVFILVGIVQFLAVGVGLAVTAGIVYGGFLYITARGNAGQTEKGRDVIANAVLGLLLFVFMAAILNFLLGVNLFR